VADTTSGFRAYNREAALSLIVVSRFTYTLETIIQAGNQDIAVTDVLIRTNAKTRESRLVPSMWAYVRRNALSIFRIYSQYHPLKVFWSLAVLLGLGAVALFIRFGVALIQGNGDGHIQSLILGAVLFNAAALMAALGVIGDLMHAQRVISMRTLDRVRRMELKMGVEPSHYYTDGAANSKDPEPDFERIEK
jgi:uncharacterized membrane protein